MLATNAITILGGGPAGLASAHYARMAGRPFALYEADDRVGGLCATLEHEGFRYDTGAHRIHDVYPETTADIMALLDGRAHAVSAPSRVYTAATSSISRCAYPKRCGSCR